MSDGTGNPSDTTELPSAILQHPRPPLRPTPARANALRRLLAVALIIGACFVCWRMLAEWWRSDASKALEARQTKARAKVGRGLDKLFAQQLDAESDDVRFETNLRVATELGAGYDAFNCGKGLTAAFAEALGPEVVTFSTSEYVKGDAPRVVLTGDVTPSGSSFQLARSNTPYAGIAIRGELQLVGKRVPIDVQPAAEIEFEYARFQMSFDPVSASEVAAGIMQATCKQAGYVVLEALTTWKRPAPPPRADPMAECDRGFRCRDHAEAVEARDAPTAAVLYAKACGRDDIAACLRATELELEAWLGGAKRRGDVAFLLELTCAQDVAAACAGAAPLTLLPYERGAQPSADQRAEALVLYLRACDLGDTGSCAAAEPLLAGTPFADAAPLLRGAPTVTSKKLGTVFALRWGQWTQLDRGQPTAWVTAAPKRLPKGALVTPFAIDELPAGIVAPQGASTVYAIALDGGRGDEDRCARCNPSGGGDSIYAMRALHCVCAIAKPR